MLADGTIQERVVTNSPEAAATILTLDLALSSAPPPESNWILASSTVQPQLFRVINRVPSSGSTEMMHEITAIEYNPAKYSQIENGWSLDLLPPRRNPPVVVSMPRNITLSYRTIDLFDLNAVWDFPLLTRGRSHNREPPSPWGVRGDPRGRSHNREATITPPPGARRPAWPKPSIGKPLSPVEFEVL
ncbi:MAG: hypothetical protein ACKPEQ_14930 [Dolichospermum sp.]